jgi:hypothetical protein
MIELTRRERGPAVFGALAVFNFGMLLLLNAHPVWRPLLGGVITERFVDVLWAANLGFVVNIIGNLVLSVTSPKALRRFFDLLFAIVAFVGVVVFYRVFPLDLSRFGGLVVVFAHVVIALGVFGAAIAILVNLVRFIGGGGTRATPAHP